MCTETLKKTKAEVSSPEYVVSLEGVSFSYGNLPVLEDVNFKIPPGDFFAIVGANGSAKSTLVKVMLGLLRPKAGQALLFGQDVKRFGDWNKVGYISQQASHINPSFPATVEEVVASGYYSGLGRFNSSGKAEAVRRSLNQVGISELSRRLIGELSGGQRQRVFLAKALVKNPQALFLDEPTTGIDADSQKEFYTLLEGLHRRGTTIVMVTHDVTSLGRGKTLCLVQEGKVELRNNQKSIREGDTNGHLSF